MGFYKSSYANKPFPHVEKLRLQIRNYFESYNFPAKTQVFKGKMSTNNLWLSNNDKLTFKATLMKSLM